MCGGTFVVLQQLDDSIFRGPGAADAVRALQEDLDTVLNEKLIGAGVASDHAFSVGSPSLRASMEVVGGSTLAVPLRMVFLGSSLPRFFVRMPSSSTPTKRCHFIPVMLRHFLGGAN